MTIWTMLARTLVRQLGPTAVRQAPRLLAEVKRHRATRPPGAPGVRVLSYSPERDGRADPGEVVWTWVAFEDDPARGKDRPVLVVGRSGVGVLALMLSSNAERDGQPHWRALGPGAWDREQRPSWVRLDRVLTLAEDGLRREGAVLERRRFDAVAAQLRTAYGWT